MPSREIGPLPLRAGKKKVGRNDPRPCGSGEKFKRCHVDGPPISIDVLPPYVLAGLRSQVSGSNQSRWEHEEQFGEVARIIHREVGGERIVTIGDAPVRGRWKTVTDFLVDYVRGRLTAEWGNEALKAPSEKQHPLIQIYLDFLRFRRREQRNQKPGTRTIPGKAEWRRGALPQPRLRSLRPG
jgi:hypothetical protein